MIYFQKKKKIALVIFHHPNVSQICKTHQACDTLPVTNGADVASNDLIKIYLSLDQKNHEEEKKSPVFVIFLPSAQWV